MSVALQRGTKKAVRTLLQLAVGGALTAAVNVLADGLSANNKVLVMTAWTVAIAFAQNTAETAGKVPTLLPTPTVVVPDPTKIVQPAVAVLDTAVDAVGDIVGEVLDVLPGDGDNGQRGGLGLSVAIGVGVIILLIVGAFATCDALWNDEDERDDLGGLGRIELVSHHRSGDEGSDNKNGSDDCSGARDGCQDNDLSVYPSFDKSPVERSFNPTICVMPGSCPPAEAEPASFFPIPNPLKFGEYLGNGFKLGTNFARVLADAIITFVADLGVFIA